MCNGLDVISSGSVSTGTGFRTVAKPDLHSAMLVVKRTNKRCWDCYVLERDRFGGGSFVVWGWKKMGDQKTYFIVLQDNFNALYRRHLVTISPLFIHIKIEVIFGIKTKQKCWWMQCFFVFVFLFFVLFFCAKFPERCGYFELKRNKCNVPIYGSMFSRRK